MKRPARGFFATVILAMIFIYVMINIWGFLSYLLAKLRPLVIDPAIEAWPFVAVLFQRLDWQWVWIPVIFTIGVIIFVIVRAQDKEGNIYRI